MDLFVVPTISFRLTLWTADHGARRRQILWLGVTAHPTAEWIANQLTAACGWEQLPRYLIRDRDACYGTYSSDAFAKATATEMRLPLLSSLQARRS
jgi:hypothetical protein